MTPAPARSRSRAHARTTIAPRGPRRISGPVPRRAVAAPAGAAALPRRGTTSIFARVRALPEHRVLDRLLRSRLWIWALGALLGGIVAMQVSLLKLNSGISRAVETTTTLERQNADLEAAIARLSATDRIQSGAVQLGMLMPAAGDVGYLNSSPDDSARAVRKMQPPSEEAAALLANSGVVPGSLAPATTLTTTPAPATISTTTTTSAPPPATTAAPVNAPAPAAQAPPPATTSSQTSATGGAVAGQG
jgi:hypothetical protein